MVNYANQIKFHFFAIYNYSCIFAAEYDAEQICT